MHMGSVPRSKPRSRNPILLLTVIWSLPMLLWGGGLFLSWKLEALATSPKTQTTVISGSRELSNQQPVSLVARHSPATELRVFSEGMITALNLTSGDVPESGEILLYIDGAPKVAYRAAVPFFRDLGIGDQGADVQTLISMLVAQGYLTDRDYNSTVTWEVRQAIIEMNSALGIIDCTYFRYSDFIFVPAISGEITEIQFTVGEIISSSDSVALAKGNLQSISITDTEGANLSNNFPESTKLALTDLINTIEIDSLEIKGAAAEDLLSFVLDSSAHQEVKTDALETDTRYVGLSILTVDPESVAVIPSTAVGVDSSGNSCLAMMDGEKMVVFHRISPTAIPGEIGIVGVELSFMGEPIIQDVSTLKIPISC